MQSTKIQDEKVYLPTIKMGGRESALTDCTGGLFWKANIENLKIWKLIPSKLSVPTYSLESLHIPLRVCVNQFDDY